MFALADSAEDAGGVDAAQSAALHALPHPVAPVVSFDGTFPGVAAVASSDSGAVQNPKQAQARAVAARITTKQHPDQRPLSTRPPYLQGDVAGVALTERELRDAFDNLDVDNNNFLSVEEFKAFYTSHENIGLGEERAEEEINTVLAQTNLLGDGVITFEEFALLMLKLAQR